MHEMSQWRFLQLFVTGGTCLVGHWRLAPGIGTNDTCGSCGGPDQDRDPCLPLESVKTCSIHDIHGANVAVELFNKRGGVLGRQVMILEADDASDPDVTVKAATRFIKENRVKVLAGTFNGDRALVVSAPAEKKHKLLMVTRPCGSSHDLRGRNRCHRMVSHIPLWSRSRAPLPREPTVHGSTIFGEFLVRGGG